MENIIDILPAPRKCMTELRKEKLNGSTPMLEVNELSVSFEENIIFEGLSFHLKPASMLGILGPSGRGKSTLLRCLNRLIDLSPNAKVTGSIRFRGKNILESKVDLDRLRSEIGIVFQQPVVFPTTIAKNVLFGAKRLQRLSRHEQARLLESALRDAALWDQVKDRLHESANRLSVGQQQRLCLARTLATQPDIILLDEPTSALDKKTAREIEQLLLRLKCRYGIILVTHDEEQARRLCDEILRI
ncbi:MAG: ATP-binding cassette domain-containing protein [Gammaproteobacteria bacterium]|nr:ATP-binding cassette domain-containing protein [Gammaproteobacteria bacterium]